MIYFQLTTAVAFVVSLVLVNLLQPGAGVTLPMASTEAVAGMAGRQRGAWESFRQHVSDVDRGCDGAR